MILSIETIDRTIMKSYLKILISMNSKQFLFILKKEVCVLMARMVPRQGVRALHSFQFQELS
jgi:hypothetical protein